MANLTNSGKLIEAIESKQWKIIAWSTAPSSPAEWDLWYDTDNGLLKIYENGKWEITWANIVPISQEDYDALPDEEKMNWTLYLIIGDSDQLTIAWTNITGKPNFATIATSGALKDATGTSDNITEGTTHLFLTTAERTKLTNTSWTNTGDQSASDFDIKDLADSTNLRTAWSWKQDKLTPGTNIQINGNTITATDTKYDTLTSAELNTGTSTANRVVTPKVIADYVNSKVSSVYKYKDSVASYDKLPSSGQTIGDVYNVEAAYGNYPAWTNRAWNGTTWDALGWSIDLSNYFNKSTDTSDAITQGTTKLFVSSTEKSTWNAKQNALSTQTAYSAKGTATKVPQITTNTLGQVTKIEEVTITQPSASSFDIKDLADSTGLRTKWTGKQDTMTAGNLIDITDNTITNNALFVITEDKVTVTTDDTKWVAPYNTSYGYTNIEVTDSNIKLIEWALYTFICDTKMIAVSANRNVRIKINGSEYMPAMNTSWILAGQSYFTKANIRYFQYTTKYQAGGAFHVITDSNTTYSAMTAAEITAGTWTTARTITPALLKTAIQTWDTNVVNDTAYASSWDWVTNVAPSKNAVYDKLNAMDTTIAGKQAALATQTAYSAKWSATKVPQITTNSLWQVTGITEVDIAATGSGDMKYDDFKESAASGSTVTMSLYTTITPSANFTVNAPSEIKEWQVYILRVTNGSTVYTMSLGTNVTNPYNTSLTLTADAIDQFVFFATGSNLELMPEVTGSGGWWHDYSWVTKTGTSITISDLRNQISTSSNITVTAGSSLNAGMDYVLRVTNSSTSDSITMTFWGQAYLVPAEASVNFRFIALTSSTLDFDGPRFVSEMPETADEGKVYYVI